MRSSRSWWAKSASLIFLIAAFGFAVKANGTVREGQGLAVAQCTASAFVTGYPAGDNTGFCSQPGFGNISGTVADAQLANAYSGVGTCSANHYVTSLARNAGPSCNQPAMTALSDVQEGNTCSWTASDQSGAGLVFSSSATNCTQNGNIYFISAKITFPVTANGSNVAIGVLPATVANKAAAAAPGGSCLTSASLTMVPVPAQNSTGFNLVAMSGAAFITNAQLTGSTINCAFWYSTN